MFNPDEFMQSTVDPLSTTFQVCPEGDYPFIIDSDPKAINFRNVKGTSDKGPYDFHVMEINCICLDDSVKQRLNREKVTVRLSVNLDLDAAGKLDTGKDKNITLGRLRDAVNQNNPGWNPKMLLGAGPFMGKVEHSTSKGNVYANIVRTAKIST